MNHHRPLWSIVSAPIVISIALFATGCGASAYGQHISKTPLKGDMSAGTEREAVSSDKLTIQLVDEYTKPMVKVDIIE